MSIFDFRFPTLDSLPSTHSRGTAGSALSGRLCFLAFPTVAACNRNRQKHTPETDNLQVSGAHAKGRGDKREKYSGRSCTNGRPAAIVAHCCISLCHDDAPSNAACSFAVSQFRSFAPSLGPEQQHIPRPALPPVCAFSVSIPVHIPKSSGHQKPASRRLPTAIPPPTDPRRIEPTRFDCERVEAKRPGFDPSPNPADSSAIQTSS